MPTNIEIKARIDDFDRFVERVRTVADHEPVQVEQRDVFFACARGRLKLRTATGRGAELIHYVRRDTSGPQPSDYVVLPVDSPAELERVLGDALGTVGIVEKVRQVFLVGSTRIHLDRVQGLGDFLEIEVVLAEGQSHAEGHEVAESLMRALGVEPERLVAEAYIDLHRSREASV